MSLVVAIIGAALLVLLLPSLVLSLILVVDIIIGAAL